MSDTSAIRDNLHNDLGYRKNGSMRDLDFKFTLVKVLMTMQEAS